MPRTPTTVDEYLGSVPEDARTLLEHLRSTIRAAAPEAVETIAYQMPAFRQDGRFLVSFAAFKDHCSLFPASDAVVAACGDELTPHLSGRGTIHFTVDDPLSDELVTTLVETRLEEVRREVADAG